MDTKLSRLQAALKVRNEEVFSYQLDIDNFKLAIQKIDKDYSENSNLVEFRKHLEHLLASSETEQLKAIIIRDVISDQIAELEAS